MVNEEISNRAINMEVRVSKLVLSEVIKVFKKINLEAEKQGKKLSNYLDEKVKSNSVPLKDLVKKGQLESITLKDRYFKELKKDLNKYGVKFSVMRDKKSNEYSLFFQSKDTVVIDKAFKNAILKVEKKEAIKESTLEVINKFKEKSKKLINDKVRNKNMEKSLWSLLRFWRVIFLLWSNRKWQNLCNVIFIKNAGNTL